jgi:hypothetical protein
MVPSVLHSNYQILPELPYKPMHNAQAPAAGAELPPSCIWASEQQPTATT